MRLNTKCSIALHCLVFISEYENKVKVTSELLAKSTGCNSAAIRSILNILQKAGIISVVRGIGGAYLVRDPKSLTVWEIYHALEPDGLEHFIGFHPNPSDKCPVGKRIQAVLKKPYDEIGASVQEAMEGITLQQLLDYYHENDDVRFDYEP
ncbi:MAG: Rrf2 family transcriptional regulator [Eubacteriales bacterium]|nr:Rrf2 family transcriptional regulator [Eubacteriales bacterium]